MTPRKGLVLDANILMRAVLGRRVGELLETYEDVASFYSPDVCFADARRYLEKELQKRGRDTVTGLAALDKLTGIVQVVDRNLYGDFEQLAREWIEIRDPDDWPVVAVALLLDLPIWKPAREIAYSAAQACAPAGARPRR